LSRHYRKAVNSFAASYLQFQSELEIGTDQEFDRPVASKPKRYSLTPDTRGRVAYRLREASELTGIPVSTFRTLARRGEWNPITGFGVWLIAAEELEVLLNKRLRNGTVRRSGNQELES
jgi:hypothetical protein